MKSMDFFAKLGVDPQSHCQCGKGMQGRTAEKDAISCRVFGETNYEALVGLGDRRLRNGLSGPFSALPLSENNGSLFHS